ncbi:MAG: response regulator, partial [Bacteroidota bacterium]
SNNNGSTQMATDIPLTILYAEDNPINQKIIQRMLAKMGYQIDIANNGAEAVKALSEREYDLILMDVSMPEMDGLTATRTIRMEQGENGPIIIAVTANAMKGDRERCLEAGMNDYLAKPVKIAQLREMLTKWGAEDANANLAIS